MLTSMYTTNSNLHSRANNFPMEQPLEVPHMISQSKILPLPASLPPVLEKPIIKRKRVQWEEDTETRDVKRRVMNMPHLPVSHFSKGERSTLWLSKEDYEATLTGALEDVLTAKAEQEAPAPAQGVCSALAQTYSMCCSPDVSSSIALENVALLSLLESSWRGLENHTLPREMRADRKIRKLKTVRRVLELQGELRVAGNPEEDATECLRLVSEYFSEPSRKFARALGEIDGTFTILMAEIASHSSSS